MRHVIWDWNGTLFADLDVVVDCVNASLAELGVRPIDAAEYAESYQRPVRRFYERIVGRDLQPEEWALIDERFHEHYDGRISQAKLATGAEHAISTVAASGLTQSILSMWRHELLRRLTEELGLAEQMVLVQGAPSLGGHSKIDLMADHLARLGIRGSDTVVVGDIDDDAIAAEAVGARCILVDAGSQLRHRLEGTGAVVVADLAEAAAAIGAGELSLR